MNPNRLLLWTSLPIIAAAGIWAWHARTTREALATTVGGIRTRQAALATERRTLAEQLARAEGNQQVAKASLADLQAKMAKRSPALAKKAPSPSPDDRLREAIQNDPVFQRLQLDARRANLTPQYAALFEHLGLTAERVARLTDLIGKRVEKMSDLNAAARTQGLRADDPAVAKLKNAAETEFQTEATALIGGDGWLEFVEYERTMVVRGVVSEFAGLAPVVAQPVTADQAEKLTALVARYSPEYQNGGKAKPENVDWVTVVASAGQILNEEQLAAFKVATARSRARQELNEMVRRHAAKPQP